MTYSEQAQNVRERSNSQGNAGANCKAAGSQGVKATTLSLRLAILTLLVSLTASPALAQEDTEYEIEVDAQSRSNYQGVCYVAVDAGEEPVHLRGPGPQTLGVNGQGLRCVLTQKSGNDTITLRLTSKRGSRAEATTDGPISRIQLSLL